MPYNPELHHRQSIRLRGYDYTQPGIYFVTICTYERQLLFDQPILRSIAERHWHALTLHFPHIHLDEWIVMPNHLHGLVVLVAEVDTHSKETEPLEERRQDAAPHFAAGSLSAIVRSYKSVVARRINRVRRMSTAPVWQRGYWERIVRDEHELDAIRQYIANNPARWAEDHDNLDALFNRMTASPS